MNRYTVQIFRRRASFRGRTIRADDVCGAIRKATARAGNLATFSLVDWRGRFAEAFIRERDGALTKVRAIEAEWGRTPEADIVFCAAAGSDWT